MDVVHSFLCRMVNRFLNQRFFSIESIKQPFDLPSIVPNCEKYSLSCVSGKFGSRPPMKTLRLLFDIEFIDDDDDIELLLFAARRRWAGFGSTFRPLTKCSFCERILSTISFLSNTRKAKPRLRPVVGSCLIEQSRILPKLEKYSRKSSCVVSHVKPPRWKSAHSEQKTMGEIVPYRQITFYHLPLFDH